MSNHAQEEMEMDRQQLQQLQFEYPCVRILVRTVAGQEKTIAQWRDLATKLGEKIELVQAQVQVERDKGHEDYNLLNFLDFYLKNWEHHKGLMSPMTFMNHVKDEARKPEFSVRKYLMNLKDRFNKVPTHKVKP